MERVTLLLDAILRQMGRSLPCPRQAGCAPGMQIDVVTRRLAEDLWAVGARRCGVEIDFDFGQGFDGPVVDVGGLVTPIANGSGNAGKIRERAVERLETGNATLFVNGGLHSDSAGGRSGV